VREASKPLFLGRRGGPNRVGHVLTGAIHKRALYVDQRVSMVLSEELFTLVCDYTRLGKKARFERAASKALSAADAAKECAPGSLIHIVALLWHAEFLVAQALHALDHLNETHEGASLLCELCIRLTPAGALRLQGESGRAQSACGWSISSARRPTPPSRRRYDCCLLVRHFCRAAFLQRRLPSRSG